VAAGTSPARGAGAGAFATIVALGVGCLALRPPVVAIGPLLPRIEADLRISHAVAGLLSTIPVLCMGLLAPAAQFVAARLGAFRAVATALAVLAVFSCLRAVAPGAVSVLALTVPLSIALAIGNALMPLAAERGLPGRPLAATGACTTGMSTGSALAVLVAVPVAGALWGWRSALGLFGLAAALSVLAWVRLAPRMMPDRSSQRPPLERLPWRSGLAWKLVLAFCAMTMYFYGTGAWLPAAYAERGWSEASTGALMAVWNVTAVVGGVAISIAGDVRGSRRTFLLAGTAALIGAMVLLILVPGGAIAWAAVAGLGNGVVFTLLMTLPLDVARTPAEVGSVSGMMLGVGYSVGALAPFVMGLLRDLTGSFSASLWVLVGVAAVLAAVSASLRPAQLRRGIAPVVP
jgi:CP family cyanate transporter-like MFS transporter